MNEKTLVANANKNAEMSRPLCVDIVKSRQKRDVHCVNTVDGRIFRRVVRHYRTGYSTVSSII